ncbi:MAG: Rieske 2Fe-2S domain-containing protein [Deltaproteobacteria bacterium]|nr:Rieske 2Fe-2S domain-containing protein [Deltaproteobacteria bacterium]
MPRSTLTPTGAAQVEVEGRAVAVFLVDGAVHAVVGHCPHRGGPLGEGTVRGLVVTCPWHRWTFDVTTGRCLSHPDRDVASRTVSLDGDDVVVEIS